MMLNGIRLGYSGCLEAQIEHGDYVAWNWQRPVTGRDVSLALKWSREVPFS
jgi:hypothetical protein